MGHELIQNFLTSPQLPDIISYTFLVVAYLSLYFVKKFVKKDNYITTLKIDDKITTLTGLHKKLENSDKLHEEERKLWAEEKKELKQEIETLKKALRISAGNTKDLVKNGISNEVFKMLPVADEENAINIEIENTDVEG